jgi:hypothetical protein
MCPANSKLHRAEVWISGHPIREAAFANLKAPLPPVRVWKCDARWAGPIFTSGPELLSMLRAVVAKIGQDFRRGMKTGVASGSLGLSRDPPLKLGRNLVEPLFRLFRSIAIDLNLDL